MKFCSKPFEQVYVRDIYVKTCPWMDITLGNAQTTSLQDLWTNEKAEMARDSIRDGSFKYCNKETCPWCASGRLEDLDKEIVKNYQAKEIPTNMNVSYDMFCNHACPSCREDFFRPDDNYRKKMKQLKERVLPFANKTEYLSTCGQGDCFASPFIMEFLRELQPENPKFYMSFETNGVFFDERHWEELKHLHKYPINITVTPNSFERYTYCYLSGGGRKQYDDLERCLANLKFISRLRKENKIASFRINMVVQESNYCEIPSFIRHCLDEYDPDLIQIKPLNRWFCLDAEGYWYKNVLNPLHPHHNNYLYVMQDPILKHEKVWDWTEESHDRDPRFHPAKYSETYVSVLRRLLKEDKPKTMIDQKLMELGVNCYAIYGAWEYGEICYEILERSDVAQAKYFIDKRRGGKGYKIKGLEIKGLFRQDFSDIDTIVVSALAAYDEIVRDLRKAGYTGKILTIKELC